MAGEGLIIPKQDYTEWKFQTYRGTKLAYDMLCKPISSDNKEKEGDNLSGDCLINLKIFTTNIEKCFSVPKMCIWEISTYEIRTVKIPGKPHFLFWGLLWDSSDIWPERDMKNPPWLQ